MDAKKQEFAQAIARVNFSSIFFIIASMLIFVLNDTTYLLTFYAVSLHIIFSLTIQEIIRRYPGDFFIRKIISTTFDLGMLSLVVYDLGTGGAFLYPMFLWIIVGNGMRYGERYLFITLGLAVTLFSTATYISPLWNNELLFSFSLVVGFIALSLFYLKLIKELHVLNEKLSTELERTKHLSLHDSLTGIPNRAFFTTYLQKTLSRNRRNKRSFAIAYMDLDGFKAVNDTYGHDYGDKLLQEVTKRIEDSLRDSDFVARLGGDEFGIILADPSGLEGSMICLERLNRTISEPYIIFDKEITIGETTGLAIYPKDGESEAELLKVADQNMYLNKNKKRHNECQIVEYSKC